MNYKRIKLIWEHFPEIKCKKFVHDFLQMVFVKEDGDEEFETVFSVSTKYAMAYFNMDRESLYRFLDEEYTSEDSEALFDKAMLDHEVQYMYVV